MDTESSSPPSSSITDFSNQKISSLRGFDDLQRHHRIHHLDLSNNPIRTLEHISSSNSLHSLNLTGTDLTSFLGSKPQPALRELFLKNTPVSHTPFYRVACLFAFGPRLKVIDGVHVSSAEKDGAFRFGADAAVAVQFGWVPSDTLERSADDYAKIIRSLHSERKLKSSSGGGKTDSNNNSSNNITLAVAVEKMFSSSSSASVSQQRAGTNPPSSSSPEKQNGDNNNNTDNNTVQKELELLNTGIVQQDKDTEIASLQAKIKELEEKLASATNGTTTDSASAAPNTAVDALAQTAKPQQQQQQQKQNVFHSMKVPGLLPSEIDSIDSFTWAAPQSTIYSFVVDRNGGGGSGSSSSSSTHFDSSSSAGFQLPQSIALTLSRHTIEIQKLMSRQAMFRQQLNQLVKVEGAEVTSSSGTKGPFKTTASLQLHFSDASSALLLFTSRTCMNAVFKGLKFRAKNLAKTISFTFDADLASLPEFLAPGKSSEEFVDFFEQTTSQMQKIQMDSSTGLHTKRIAVTHTAGALGLTIPINTMNNSNKRLSASGINPSPGSTSLSSPNWGGDGSTSSNTNNNNNNNGNNINNQIPPLGKPPSSASLKTSPQVSERLRVATPSDFGASSGDVPPQQKPDGDDDATAKTPLEATKTEKKRNTDSDSDDDDSFDLNDDPKKKKEKKDGDSDSDSDDKKKEKPKGGLRAPGGGTFAIPTAVKVGRVTPSSTTPRLVNNATPQGDAASAASGGGGGKTSSTPSSTPVTIGNFKGKAIVVQKKKDSDDDSDDDSDSDSDE